MLIEYVYKTNTGLIYTQQESILQLNKQLLIEELKKLGFYLVSVKEIKK